MSLPTSREGALLYERGAMQALVRAEVNKEHCKGLGRPGAFEEEEQPFGSEATPHRLS